jgi:L-threonylcarbamoyladenylate synthase
LKTERLHAGDSSSISHAVDVLQRGGVVAFPTDTVYGLGSLAFEPESVERLYTIKGREHTKAIALLIADTSDLDRLTNNPSPEAQRLAQRFWPGALTLVLPRREGLPEALSQGPTIGVRVPDHPVALALLKAAGPMGVTSANLSGQPNTNTAEEVLAQLEGRIHLVLDGGRTPGGVPSTVVEMVDGQAKILRNGPVSEAEILATLA